MFGTIFTILLCAYGIFATDTTLSGSLSKFSSELYQKIIETDDGKVNVIISPYSMAVALAMVSGGAKGTTFNQISSGLHLTGDKQMIANKFSESMTELRNEIGSSTMNIANKIYLKTGSSIKPEFKDIVVEKYHSDVEHVDFLEKQQAANQINHWVEEKTHNKIKNLILPQLLTDDTKFVLINAIYFKGAWEKPFEVERTLQLPFWVSQTEVIQIDFMRQKEKFLYGKFTDLGLSALKMKYNNSDASMLILLPDSRMGITDLEKKLHTIDSRTITNRMRQDEVIVTFPKFQIEFKIEMERVLSQMGITDLFSSNADLTDILTTPQNLYVSHIIHKAFIDVNEKGAEASGATGIIGEDRMARETPIPIFLADHPFIYYILRGDDVIFMGRKSQ